ncbi:MAG TPA: hypothetical protein VGV35_09045, partial [Bryobacteraceae bacterium]|nr:hypothetical protein [Bryobacteraceae bacterium]
ASTLSTLLGKTPASVRVLLVVTVLLVPCSLLLQVVLTRRLASRTGYRQSAIDAVSWRPGFRVKPRSDQELIQNAAYVHMSNEAVYEYSLYGAIVLLTALAVIFYVAGSHDPQISSLNNYASTIHFGLIGWAFHRLDALYDRRKSRQPERADLVVDGCSIPTVLVRDYGWEEPEVAQELARVYRTEPAPSILGLTFAQLAIALAVFLTACLTFTWALSRLW